MYGQLEALILGLMNFLGVPPGITVQRYYGGRNDVNSPERRAAQQLRDNEFIKTIIDITSDDVCIGASPYYLYGGEDNILSPRLLLSYKSLVAALNTTGKWTAIDLLGKGWSVYSLQTQEIETTDDAAASGEKLTKKFQKPNLVPLITDKIHFYMKTNGEVITYIGETVAQSHLVFLNFSKDSLRLIEDHGRSYRTTPLPDDYLYEIIPEPIQLKHVSGVAKDLWTVERAMYTYRMQLSKIVRFAEVEIGTSYGGNGDNQDAIDSAASAVNANSTSFANYQTDASQMFDDNIPIVPLRKGNGAINIKSDIPDFSQLKEMPDLEYTLNRLFLAMRFPKTYADFNEALQATAVSLIRGDIRYSRMVDYTRAVIQDTVNKWVFGPLFDPLTAPVQIKLTALPNSEDDDVVDALSKYVDFNQEAFNFISGAETGDEARLRLQSIMVALGDVANIIAIQKWSKLMGEWIEAKFPAEDGEDGTSDEGTGEEGLKEEESEPESGASNELDEAAEVFEQGATAADFDLPPMNE